MAEPFSVAASGLALIHLGVKVYQLCDDYCDVVKESQQDFKKLGDEIRSIDKQLKEIRSLATQGDENNPRYPELLEWTKNESLKGYQTTLEELKDKLDVPGWRKSSRKLLWPVHKPKMERYLGLVAEQRSKLQLLLNTATTKTVTKMSRKQDESEFREVQRWLNVVDPATNFSSALAVREPGTGNWLLEGRDYKYWREGSGGVLWLHGIPGCGKSVLSATVIEDIQSLCSMSDDHALAYFYFTFSDSQKQNLANMLLSLIGQLLRARSDLVLPDEIMKLYHNSKAIGTSPNIKDLRTVFSRIAKLSKKAFIILDALDEFPKETRGSVLSWIGELTVDHDAGSLPILVTSRPEADIVGSLEPLTTFAISLQSGIIDADIRAYIQNSLDGKDGFKKFTKEIRCEIEDTLVSRAQGMFRWVDCLLRILQECITPKAVRGALKELPKDLDSVYLRILDSIHETQREYIQRAMHWLSFSAKPLTLGQLAEAVVIESDVNNYGEDPETLFEIHSLMSICPSLISFEDARDDQSSAKETRLLRLAHFSVKEYLISDRAAQGPSAYYHISEDKANLLMSHACLSRILRYGSQVAISADKIQVTPFLRHSARYWFIYIKAIENIAPAPLSNASLKVLELGQSWLDIHNPDDPDWNRPLGSRVYPPAIYYSSLLNLVVPCKLLVDRKEDAVNVDAQGGCYGNALQAATIRGNESVLQLLLERGADVNAQGGEYGNALQAAASEGKESVVQFLLGHGAEVNAPGGILGNALQAAARSGQESVVQLLLDRGAEVNAQGGHYGNALQAAAQSEKESVVQLLLEHGADVNAQGGRYGNALQAAERLGADSVIQLLLKYGAERKI
ncbi:unnamed protein product [Tuber aestivum]|uniref:NACHT domain-containing protein n=1 Tax=Tuber aestivum TaxID=59557 RepID=A0A292PVN3_9PEZI|nr:unnamed protein product [Tuber aestivum]